MFWPADWTLKLEVALPEYAIAPAVHAALAKYAAELCADFDLRVNLNLAFTPNATAAENHSDGALFHIWLNNRRCRLRWWPHLPIRKDAPAQEVTAVVGTALWENRELLINREMSDKAFAMWLPLPTEGAQEQGSTLTEQDQQDNARKRGEFYKFLLLFLRYNHSLRHAEKFLRENFRIADSINAELWFERAVEESRDLRYGAAVALPREEILKSKPEYAKSFSWLATRVTEARGLVTGAIAIETAPLGTNTFQIRLNDVHLPVLDAPLATDVLFSDLRAMAKLRSGARVLVDPFGGCLCSAAEDSPETAAALREAGTEAWTHAPAGYLTRVLESAVYAAGGTFLSPAITASLLERQRQDRPQLVRVARARLGNAPPFHLRITALLRKLADEGVAVKDLPGILSGVAWTSGTAPEAGAQAYYSLPGEELLEIARRPLSSLSAFGLTQAARLRLRSIAVRNVPPLGYKQVLRWLFLPERLEQELAAFSENAVVEPVGPQAVEHIAVQQELAARVVRDVAVRVLLDGIRNPAPYRDYALVVAHRVRPFVDWAIRREFPSTLVVASKELPASLYGAIEPEKEPLLARHADAPPTQLPVTGLTPYSPEPAIPRLDDEQGSGPGGDPPAADVEQSVAIAASLASRGRVADALEQIRLCGEPAAGPEAKQALAQGCHLIGRTLVPAAQTEAARQFVQQAVARDPEVPLYHYDLAQILDLLGQPGLAAQSYRQAGLVAGDSAIWQAAIDKVFRQRGTSQDAIEFYKRAATLDPGNAELRNQVANRYYSAGAFRKAIDSFRHAAEIEPKAAVYHANLGDALTMQGDYVSDEPVRQQLYAEGIAEYQRAISIEANFRFQQHLSWPLARLRRYAEAEDAIRIAIASCPDAKRAGLRLELADYLSRQGNYSEAAKEFQACADGGANSPQLQVALAKAHLGAGEFEEAANIAAALARPGTQDAPTQEPAGRQADNFGGFAKSLADARDLAHRLAEAESTGHAPAETAEAVFWLADLNQNLGNLPAAIALYRRAIGLAPTVSKYHRHLGNVLYKEVDYVAAIEAWKLVAPQDALSLNNIGTAYDGLGDREHALASYEASAASPGASFVPQFNIGRLKYRQSLWAPARDAFEQCLLKPAGADYPPVYHNLGNCYWQLQETEKSNQQWREATKRNPNFAEAYFNLGVAAWRYGVEGAARTDAAEWWRKALQCDRNLAAAEDNLEAIETNQEPKLEIFDALHGK